MSLRGVNETTDAAISFCTIISASRLPRTFGPCSDNVVLPVHCKLINIVNVILLNRSNNLSTLTN